MISVVVPVYNVEKYILKCIESIVLQNYKDYELILVNDGSKDGSIDLAETFLKDKDVDWKIVDKENGGLASARNAGLKAAKGEYVVFIDSDDVISPDFLPLLSQQMKEDIDFSFCAFRYVKDQVPPIDCNDKRIVFDKKKIIEYILKKNDQFCCSFDAVSKEFSD